MIRGGELQWQLVIGHPAWAVRIHVPVRVSKTIASPPRPDIVRVHYSLDASTYLILNPERVLGCRSHADYDYDSSDDDDEDGADDDERRPIAVTSVHVFLSVAVVDRRDRMSNSNSRRHGRDLMLMDP
mmetsp:Transcript_24425/g.52912  ORF Transcript_24425/g.52912 Transcript_24425/m.52912 type:complete len:128 (+) Transcript_24425:457-840(+)